ncbi:histidine kinase [Chitinophaga caseinilytica]|uniref:Histidine kinase n=1 Tax=Chitinophaga caseinilytica TaxID=2267521 RepID=A0ABZ2Z2K6_9BACT
MPTQKTYRYWIHLAVWMALVLLYIFPMLKGNISSPLGFRYTITRFIVYGFINFHLFYLLAFVVYPLHARLGNARAFLLAFGTVLAFCILKYGVGNIWPDQILQLGIAMIGFKKTYHTFWSYFRVTLQTGIMVGLAAYAYYVFLMWRTGDRQSRRLELEAAAAGKQFAQMQVSTGLLLRKLKAIKSLLENEEKREGEGAEAILQLSELLRYMLYDKGVKLDKAPLDRELYYFNIYLKLHNRLFPGQQVSLHMTGPTTGRYVTPLLLQTAAEKLLARSQTGLPVVLKLEIGADELALSSSAGTSLLQRLAQWLPGTADMRRFKTPLYAGPA